jgi:magnesium-transporting ATPase (P-type)
MRVLGLCYKIVPAQTNLAVEMTKPDGFQMVALLGIMDPPRPEAIVAVQHAHEAFIVVKMITGDHPVTAVAIGRQLGLSVEHAAITGAQLDDLANDEKEFDAVVLKNDIFARTTPEHKLRIVQSLQRQGCVCSMTGDGVNDAPALKAANIGVAMGITGTEVAKDAANMIITDDNFATIVDAVRVGRCTYNNLVKILSFMLPTNGGQAFCIITALVIGLDVPITALQILWVNLVTSLGLVLAFELPHDDIMRHPPRRPGKAIFGKFLSWRVVYVSIIIVCVVLGNFQWEKARFSSLNKLRTISVNTLCASQIGYIFTCRYLRENVNPIKMFTGNPRIYIAVLAVAGFQALFTYAPPFQYIFLSEPLDAQAWGKIAFWGVVVFFCVELEKFIASLKAEYFSPIPLDEEDAEEGEEIEFETL